MKDEMIGKKFGKLTPIERIGGHRNSYLCKCDCGNTSKVPKHSLMTGNTKSCGCLVNKIDIIEKKFGKLTVIKEYDRDHHNKLRYLCKCDCGNEKIVRKSSLLYGGTKSCGCLVNKNIIGKKYNLLTVIEKDSVVNGVHYYKCDCDCGTKGVVIARSAITTGGTKSCGCLKKKANRIKFMEEKKANE